MKKSLLFLLLCLLLLTLAACTDPPPAPSVEDGFALVQGGQVRYTIVRPEEATPGELDATFAVRAAILRATGAEPTVATDWIKLGSSYDASTCEILIGGCAQPEAVAVREGLGYGSYAVRGEGRKLVITAWSDEGLAAAAEAFSRASDEYGYGGTLTLPADFAASGSVNEMVDRLPSYVGGSVRGVVDCADRNHMLYVTDTTPEAYDAYRTDLEAAGYTLYTERTVAGNRFATYTSAQDTINAYYTPCDNEVRVIIEPAAALPPRAADTATANEVCTPAVRLIGLEHIYTGSEYNQIGLSMMFRLPDGRLIVVDGGGYYDRNADMLLESMRELAPDPNSITIAAWVLTHAHGDHTGGFVRFARTYADRVKVERVICNFTTDAQYARIDDDGLVSQARAAAVSLADDVIRAHNGQLYHFGSATLEILYTFEDFEPKALPYHNTTSLILRLSMGGQTVMVLGDAYTLSNDIMSDMYGDYLRSDIVQITHHGYQGGTLRVYDLIDATTALWPGGTRHFPKLSERTENALVLRQVRDLYIAGPDVTTIELPYSTVGNNRFYAG